MHSNNFIDPDACELAKDFLSEVISAKNHEHWLLVQFVETEAYSLKGKASHASLGFTDNRKGFFMPAGTIEKVIQSSRLGMAPKCDSLLPYRFMNCLAVDSATSNLLQNRKPVKYQIVENA